MKRIELVTNLISEISNYMLKKDPTKLVLSLHQEEDGLHLVVLDNATHTDEEIIQMKKDLNSKKRPELVSYYGTMTGHDLLGSVRLNLLGWQVKHTDVCRNGDEGVRLDFWIGGDRFDSRKFSIPDKD